MKKEQQKKLTPEATTQLYRERERHEKEGGWE
jgi:hypothetical protein